VIASIRLQIRNYGIVVADLADQVDEPVPSMPSSKAKKVPKELPKEADKTGTQWSGPGRKPRWLKDAEKSVEDFGYNQGKK
jgi:DNA-binding protein H-NS